MIGRWIVTSTCSETDLLRRRVRLFFVEGFLPYSWAFLPADASLQCSFRGDSNQASAYPRLSGGQPSLETVPNTVGLSPSGALPSGHSRGVLVRCRGKGGRPAMAVTTGFQGRTFDVPRTGVPCIDLPSRAPCAAADAVFADAKAFLSSSEARQMSESELERELHRRRQDLARKLLQGHRDQRSPKEAAGPAEDTSGVSGYSGGSGTRNPEEVEHRFRRKWNSESGKWNTESGGSGTAIPEEVEQRFRRS